MKNVKQTARNKLNYQVSKNVGAIVVFAVVAIFSLQQTEAAKPLKKNLQSESLQQSKLFQQSEPVQLLKSAELSKTNTIILDPVADNWLSSCSSGSDGNNGSSTELRVRTAMIWSDIKNFRALMRFDLSDFSADSQIINATFGVYYFATCSPSWNPEGRFYDIHRVANYWNEMASNWYARDDCSLADPVYWNSYLDGVPAYRPGGGDFHAYVYASAEVPPIGNWMTWNVTDLFNGWLNEDYPNEGFIIKDADEFEEYVEDVSYGPARFYSTDYFDENYRPYLEITFVEPVEIEAAYSCMLHGDAGEFCLSLTDENNIEPRQPGVTHIEFDMSDVVTSMDASVSCVENEYDGTITTTADGSNVVIVEFVPALPDIDCCTITLSGDSEDNFNVVTLKGDINSDGQVTTGDASSVKLHYQQYANENNFLFDYNVDGQITTGDFSAIKLKYQHIAPDCQ